MTTKLKEKVRNIFRDYPNPIELFKHLIDGNINPKRSIKRSK